MPPGDHIEHDLQALVPGRIDYLLQRGTRHRLRQVVRLGQGHDIGRGEVGDGDRHPVRLAADLHRLQQPVVTTGKDLSHGTVVDAVPVLIRPAGRPLVLVEAGVRGEETAVFPGDFCHAHQLLPVGVGTRPGSIQANGQSKCAAAHGFRGKLFHFPDLFFACLLVRTHSHGGCTQHAVSHQRSIIY